MSDSNGTFDGKRRNGKGRGALSRSYFTGDVFTYPLIFKYPTMTTRHAVAHDDVTSGVHAVDVVRPVAQAVPSPYRVTEIGPPPCAMGACQFCGRTLVSVFGHQDRQVSGTCGACAKARRG